MTPETPMPSPRQEPELDRLLEIAGRRRPAPRDARSEIKAAARQVWVAKVEQQAQLRRQRNFRHLALAATLLLVAALAFQFWQTSPAPVQIATVETVLPGTTFSLAEQDSRPLAAGDELPPDSVVETSPEGRCALRLPDGTSARLDTSSRLRLAAADTLILERGAIYIDTGAPAATEGSRLLAVETPYGTARDIGTQFEVRLLDQAVRIHVREGKVELSRDAAQHIAEAGQLLLGHADGRVDLGTISAHHDDWSWILKTAPPFRIQNRTLEEVLAWVQRETGWQIRYDDAALERDMASITVLAGVEGLRPDQIPALVLPSSGLDYRLEDGVLHIQRSGS